MSKTIDNEQDVYSAISRIIGQLDRIEEQLGHMAHVGDCVCNHCRPERSTNWRREVTDRV